MKVLILNEEELIKRCVDKDRHAEEFLFNKYYKEFYSIAMRYLSDHHDAEDVIILAYTRIFRSLKNFSFQGQGSLGKWVRTILINESIRLLKKKNLIEFNEDIKVLDNRYTGADGLQQLQASEITRMIEKLPTGYRTVFNLFAVEGYAHKEIAQMLGVSENTSKTQLKKARHQLMKNIKDESAYGTI